MYLVKSVYRLVLLFMIALWLIACAPATNQASSPTPTTVVPTPTPTPTATLPPQPFTGTYSGHTAGVVGVAWSPDGKLLASASDDYTVHIWDAATGQTLINYTGHSSHVWAVAWSPDGQQVASASQDSTVVLWKP